MSKKNRWLGILLLLAVAGNPLRGAEPNPQVAQDDIVDTCTVFGSQSTSNCYTCTGSCLTCNSDVSVWYYYLTSVNHAAHIKYNYSGSIYIERRL